jgi:hypothetical protein
MHPIVSENYYTLQVLNNIVICRVSKRISIQEFYHIFDHIVETAKVENADRMLVDFSSVDFSDLTVLERHKIGLKVAEAWRNKKAVAVVQKEYINKHGENVANNRGGNALVTDDYNEAINWLSK